MNLHFTMCIISVMPNVKLHVSVCRKCVIERFHIQSNLKHDMYWYQFFTATKQILIYTKVVVSLHCSY